MPNFICEKCNKEFTKKSSYNFHVLRINSCIKDVEIINNCNYCNKKFTTKYTLKAHLNICKKKDIVNDHTQSQIDELKKILCEQQKDNEELKKKVEELTHISETNQNININENSHNTNNNNTTNNINIYNIGKEDLTRLSKEDIIKICTSGTFYPQVAAEVIHCNEKYPEFQNFLISNLRSNTGLIRDNDNWISKSNDDILRAILKVDKKHVSTLIKDLKVDEKLQIRLEITKDEVDTNESKQHQAAKIKTLLYNASKMITKNKKKVDKLT